MRSVLYIVYLDHNGFVHRVALPIFPKTVSGWGIELLL